jgi:primosomal protein N' (replication factor Y) (superfamily II helicase)
MSLYNVWVGTRRYHKPVPLTYSSNTNLEPGALVEVTMQGEKITGIVAGQLKTKPKFAVKPIDRVVENVKVPLPLLKLHGWLQQYYPAPSGLITQLLIPGPLPKKVTLNHVEILAHTPLALPKLTKDQAEALKAMSAKPSGTLLLHGDTGTGKTRVYLELAKKALASGKSTVILTPEIGLTPQLSATFKDEFGQRVIVTHSHLTSAERRAIWLTLASSAQPYIVIGPRSALFMPLSSIGVIIMDEAHDSSYKQEQAPNYQTTRVAAKLAQIHNCLCVLGTATPLVADYFSLKQRGVPIIRMTQPVSKHIKAPIVTVVKRSDKTLFERSWLFSEQLLKAIEESHSAGKTSLIFLNRRGTARLVLCNNCAWHAECPNCDVALTYHQDSHKLQCHLCNYQMPMPLACPNCQSTDISLHSVGTKGLQTELERIFPDFRFGRFDSDTSTADSLRNQYQSLLDGSLDVIIGTQMIAKGLDLPSLGLVAIPFADTSLYIPDFTADEQTYQLLTQVMGRVGRTNQPTKIFVQAFDPKQPAIKAALDRNWDDFYNKQLAERKQFGYPPYCYVLQLSYSAKSESTISKASQVLLQKLNATKANFTTLGPSPRFHHKINGNYSWQIILKAHDRSVLVDIIKILPSNWRYNLDPTNLL